MKDEKGYLYIFDAILVITLILIAVLMVNTVISMNSPNYSETVKDFKTAQDIMEVLSGKVNTSDRTFFGDISAILIDGENSKESIRNVSVISKNKFDSFKLDNYRFVEGNVLNGKVLAGKGDYNHAYNVSVASRSYGDYFYTLSVW